MVDVALLSDQTRMLGDFGRFALRAQNLDDVLQRACELLAGMLRDRRNGGSAEPQHLVLGYTLIRRQSDAAPRQRPRVRQRG